VLFMHGILRFGAPRATLSKTSMQLINKFADGTLSCSTMIVSGMNAAMAATVFRRIESSTLMRAACCHTNGTSKKRHSAGAASYACGSQQNPLNAFAAFVFTKMHALYPRPQQ
jgi:hypothetical protein